MTRPSRNQNSKAVPRSLSVLITVLLLNLMMQPLSLGTDRSEVHGKDRLSRLDRARAGDDPANLVFAETKGRLAAENQSRRVEFTAAGIKFLVKAVEDADSRDSFEFRFKTAAIGESVLVAEGTHGTEPVSQANEVFYARSGSVLEKYRATERGVEQLIVLDRNFAAALGDLEITGEVVTTLAWEEAPVRALGALTFYSEHGPALNFGPVVVTDASGRQSEVETRLEGTRLTLVVDATWLSEANYPLSVQSCIQTLARPSRPVFGEPLRLAVNEPTRVNAGSTTLTSIEDMPVWRAQLRVSTAFWNDGGTDNPVLVKLNPDNSTWLNSSGDDFEPYTSYTYDLLLHKVTTLRDITMLRIYKPYSDLWCMASLTLYVNGKAVYSAQFGQGLWLNKYDELVILPHELRNHSLWRSYIVPSPPMSFSRAELEKRIEAFVGNYLTANTTSDLSWASAVQVTRTGSNKIHVDLELKYSFLFKSFWIWDWKVVKYEVDAEFDLEFSCAGGKIFLATRNLDMNYPVVDGTSMTDKAVLQTLLQAVLPINTQSSLQAVTYTNDLGQTACPIITVLSDGSVSLSF